MFFKNKKLNWLIILLVTMALFSLSSTAVFAANVTIDENTTGGINSAIGNVNHGDTVFLNPGTYNKTNQDMNIAIPKNITLQGNGSTGQVIIDGRKLSRIFTVGNSSITNNNLNIKFVNITFMNGKTNDGAAIYAYGNNISITFINCLFINNNATSKGGALYNSYVNNKLNIVNSTFINNIANAGGGAIWNDASNSNISNSTFINNTLSNGAGGAILNSGVNFTIANSSFSYNALLMGENYLGYSLWVIALSLIII